MGRNSKKKKAAAPAAATADLAVNGNESPVDSGAAVNGVGIPPPMATPVEPANCSESPADSAAAAAAAIGDEVAPQLPSVEAANGDELPLDSAAAANKDGVPPPPPFSVEAPNGDKTPVHPAAEANGDVIPPPPPLSVEAPNGDKATVYSEAEPSGAEIPPPVDSAVEANGYVVEQPPFVEADRGGSEPTAVRGLDEDSSEERRDSSLDREGESEKLKSLNGVLVKEAVETRGQVAALTAQVDQRSVDTGTLAGVERDVFQAALLVPLLAAAEYGVALRGQLADVHESLQAAEARAAREKDARTEVEARLDAAEAGNLRFLELLGGKDAEAASASKNVAGMEALVSEFAGKSTELCAEKGDLEKQLGETSATAHRVHAQKAEVEGSFRDYRMNTEKYKQETEGKLGEKSKQLEALRSSKVEMEVKFQSLEAELSAALARNRELNSELETSKTELAAAKTQLEKLLVEIADAGEKYTTVVAEADSLRNEIHKMMTIKEAAVSALSTEKSKLEKELDGMKRKVDMIRANKDTAMASFHQKDAEASKLRAELSGLRDSIAEQHALCEKLRAKSSSLQAEVDTVQKALDMEKAEGGKLRVMLEEVEAYNAEKEREIVGLKSEVQNKRGRVYTLDGEVKKLQLEVAAAKQRGKSGVWTWLCPTTTVIAAASFAYAARSR